MKHYQVLCQSSMHGRSWANAHQLRIGTIHPMEHMDTDAPYCRIRWLQGKTKAKLQVKLNGEWKWVKDLMESWEQPYPVTTTSKLQAMPRKTYWCQYSLPRARKLYPHLEFRLAESRYE